MVATHVEIQTNLEQTKSIIKARKETIAEKENRIEKQNNIFSAYSANWQKFLVHAECTGLKNGWHHAFLLIWQEDFASGKLRMQEGTLQCKVECFQGMNNFDVVVFVVLVVPEFTAVLRR